MHGMHVRSFLCKHLLSFFYARTITTQTRNRSSTGRTPKSTAYEAKLPKARHQPCLQLRHGAVGAADHITWAVVQIPCLWEPGFLVQSVRKALSAPDPHVKAGGLGLMRT